MSHKRIPEVRYVPIADLPIPLPREYDPHGFKLITQELLGKIPVALTRMNTSNIVRGFFKRVGGRVEHFTELESQAVDIVSAYIRGGARPQVEIYWSPLAPNGGAYVCSDAEAVLEAYIGLNVRVVPVRILRPKSVRCGEGALWLENRQSGVGITKLVPSQVSDEFRAVDIHGKSPKIALEQLAAWSLKISEAARAFHIDHPSRLHYHQMLNAVARRQARFLDSIRLLLGVGRVEHAALLARTCYEAYLNFYLDWLAPEFIGPRLQLLSLKRLSGQPDLDLACLCNFVELFEKTAIIYLTYRPSLRSSRCIDRDDRNDRHYQPDLQRCEQGSGTSRSAALA